MRLLDLIIAMILIVMVVADIYQAQKLHDMFVDLNKTKEFCYEVVDNRSLIAYTPQAEKFMK